MEQFITKGIIKKVTLLFRKSQGSVDIVAYVRPDNNKTYYTANVNNCRISASYFENKKDAIKKAKDYLRNPKKYYNNSYVHKTK